MRASPQKQARRLLSLLPIFFHPDYTVGFGLSPNQHWHCLNTAARGLFLEPLNKISQGDHRRSGIGLNVTSLTTPRRFS
jgi:hypothetical protein